MSEAAIQAFLDLYFDVILPRWPGRDDTRGHGDVPGASTECPGEAISEDVDAGVLTDRSEPPEPDEEVEFTVAWDLSHLDPQPIEASLDEEAVLTLTFLVDAEQPQPDPEPEPPDNGDTDPPDEPQIPQRPSNGLWTSGTGHDSFTAMGRRFKEWLSNNEIARAGEVYNPGPTYSDWDDFNVRKIQALMGNDPDPVGEAFLGPKQWSRLFTEDRPPKSNLPSDLQGQVPPQREDDEPEPPSLPELPGSDDFEPGTRHDSFTKMGERFAVWLDEDEISHDGDGYQSGPVISEYDDFNIRKVQAKMDNPPDPAGKAYFGPKQWEFLFSEGPPSGGLPRELQGRIPPQLRDNDGGSGNGGGTTSPPKLPGSSMFQPGKTHESFTDMGERFLEWLRDDEIHKTGSVYTPGPRYSKYDDRNVRAVQALMDNTVDPEGEEFFGPQQWERLFTEGRPSGARVPSNLRPGGSGGSSGGGGVSASLVPVRGHRITVHYGVAGDWAAGYHTGVDLGAGSDRTIRSVGAGKVMAAGRSGDWGNRVIVKHDNGRFSWHCHLQSISVSRGQSIRYGQKVGVMGETGRAFGVHDHYQETVGGYGYWDHKRPTMLGFGGYG